MTTSRHAVLRAALVGAALGAAWGVLARVWMRLVSTSPEFSWVGTLAIIGLATVFGAGVGTAAAARRQHGWRRWLRVAVLPGMVMFLGQGMPFLPALVVAGPLAARRHPIARALAALAVVGPSLAIWWADRLDETTMLSAPQHVQIALLTGMPLLSAALAWAGHLAWGPRPQRVAVTPGSVDGVARPRPQEAAQGLQA